MNPTLLAALHYCLAKNNQSLLNMLESYATEAEGQHDIADWFDLGSFEYWLSQAPFKRWQLKNMDPQKLKYHHDRQEESAAGRDEMKNIRLAKSPNDIPPIVVDGELTTVDGAHRLRVAQEDGWEFIKTWVPDTSSKMSEEEIDSLDPNNFTNDEILENLKKI
jgi:hypothetical protein